MDTADKPAVYTAILCAVAAAVIMALTGCGNKSSPDEQFKGGSRKTERYGPDEFGVVCYRFYSWEGISCVKVMEASPCEWAGRDLVCTTKDRK